jgi:hypothetical protein
MSTDTVTSGAKPAASTSSLASSTRFRTFAVTFGIVGTVAYNVCLYFNWPLFTFHPATNRFAWGFEAARSGEGPNMTWYGWTATTLLVAAAIGYLATFLPERIARRISLTLLWLLPWLAIPLLIWDLRQWWFHK